MRQLKRQAEVEQAEQLRKRNRNIDPERLPVGSDAVARELDDLNAKYQRLMDMLYERLRRIAAANPGDIVTLVSVFLKYLLKSKCKYLAVSNSFTLHWQVLPYNQKSK